MTKRQQFRPVYAKTRGAKWRHRLGWLLVLLLIAGLVWGGMQWLHHRQAAVVKGFDVRGIAVTQNDGYLDFDALAQDGLKFVYLKSTQGASYTDDNFSSNYSRILGTNLGVGVSQVFSFSSSGKAQAAYFEKVVNNNIGNLPIAIQVQYYGDYTAKTVDVKRAQNQLRTLVLKLTDHYDRSCVIWSTPSVAKQIVKPVIKQSPLWLDTSNTQHRPTRVLFMSYSQRAVYRQNGTSQEFTGVLFNGGNEAYQKLVAAGLN
ncbi:GH25 family lysozyme [Lactiplantibacillus sp. WILCCON 0030]|uniref:GH25 family lysozyme n=1 Tax=Lactiplantibacillus brownii TaxID=3069269 RepID=A0ABU1A7K3_9LACO|nr:GH25 family lysozyme [Lactiplantibacillus brownii]MDQ7936932.1 GH25 family lysozyme [Lactiplantibacillus brownii]